MSRYTDHIKKWEHCTECGLCNNRKKVVMRIQRGGTIPAPILFVGEAPGPSENLLGLPFIGPAGKLLDEIIERAWHGAYKFAMTNLVACIPKGNDGDKFTEPPKEAIMACAPRLQELVALCRPKLVICVGKLSEKWARKTIEGMRTTTIVSWCTITHPAAILRAEVVNRGLMVQRCIVTLEDAVTVL